MPNILTATEAANAIRVENTDADVLQLLPLVDKFIERATGRDWTQDSPINDMAKSCARMLIVQWYENPGQISVAGESLQPLAYGLTNALSQLEVEALTYRRYSFDGRSGAGDILLPGALKGDAVVKLVGVAGLSGSQTSKFESTISDDRYIAQTDGGDLSDYRFVAILRSPADGVRA